MMRTAGFVPVFTALVLLSTGCSSNTAKAPGADPGRARDGGGGGGGAWDLVLAGPAAWEAGQGPELGRRNGALQWSPQEPSLTRALADPFGPPDLVRSRRVTMPRDPGGYIYYLDLRRDGRTWRN
jgi:hypothetical protein